MSPAKAPVPSAPTRRKPIAQGTALVLNHKLLGVIPLMIWIVGWSFFVAERLCEGSRGFQPTVQRTRWDCVAARRLMRRPRIGSPGFRRRSATQSHLDHATRGLKPTATIMRSLPRPGGWSCNHEMCITIRALPWAIECRPVGAWFGGIELATGGRHPHFTRVNITFSQRKATRRDQSRPVAEWLLAENCVCDSNPPNT